MKLLELKIRNIRGLTRLDLSLNGETFAIIGANGTGKSAVVDAVDFLLTGDMARLSGRRGLSLQRHGKHVNAKPEDCYVEAIVNVPGITEPVSLRRNFRNPSKLIAPPEALVRLKPFLAVAAQRQYVLARANILKFISAQPRDRAALVQAVLNIDRVEELRKTLTKAANAERHLFETARSSRISAEGAVSETLGLAAWGDKEAIDAVNRLRDILGGSAIGSPADAKKDLTPPGVLLPDTVAPTVEAPSDIIGDIRGVGISVNEATEAQVDAWDDVLRTEATTLNASPENARAARQIELVELGIKLLDDATKCPLCDTDWNPEDLRGHLEAKVEGGRVAAPSWRRLRQTADSMLRWLADNVETIGRIVDTGRQGDHGSDPAPLKLYSKALVQLRTALGDPLSLFLEYRKSGKKLSEQLGISAARELLRSLYGERAQAVSKSPAHKAWDTLTRAEENFKALGHAKKGASSAFASARRLESLRAAFIDARDRVLCELYDSVKERFVALYKELHAPEEQDFDADMAPDEAGLSLEVDFHGTGKVAPFALHSDGHQDSMGLCLFLALAEKTQGTRLGFCLLDDVVMAIDVGHRMNVARLLSVLKAETQFVIATQDQTWVKQLQEQGCVTSKTCIRFIGWTLDGGSVVATGTDFLGETKAALTKGNVRDAAASLRYGLEAFFHFVADSIRAEPPYSLSGQYELGQMYNACNRKLRELIKDGKKAAESWEHDDVVRTLTAVEQRRSEILDDAQTTQWAVNANVHFNAWMTMDPKEFQPVLKAFEKVCGLFKCGECHSILKVVLDGASPKTVTCNCGNLPWNLQKKPPS